MVPSLHCQTIFNGDENIDDLEKAWRLDILRDGEKRIPSRCRDPKLVQYWRSCNLGAQLTRLYETVDRERVLTSFLEDIQ